MLKKDIIPACYSGLTVDDLPVPLANYQGLALTEPEGIKRLYGKLARNFDVDTPEHDFAELARTVPGGAAPVDDENPLDKQSGSERDSVGPRLRQALEGPHKWRSLERVAIEAGVSKDVALERLQGDYDVAFGKGQSGNMIVGLRARVRP